MSLIPKRKGNPNWIKGGPPANPNGRPRGTKNKYALEKVQERLKKLHKLHPVDKLVNIAIMMELNNQLEEAATIWTKLLTWCEPQKKAVETLPEEPKTLTPEDSKENALKLLQEMEQIADGSERTEQPKASGSAIGLGNGPTNISPKTSTTPHIPGNPISHSEGQGQ